MGSFSASRICVFVSNNNSSQALNCNYSQLCQWVFSDEFLGILESFFWGWHFLDVETNRWRCGKFWWWWTCWHCRRSELNHQKNQLEDKVIWIWFWYRFLWYDMMDSFPANLFFVAFTHFSAGDVFLWVVVRRIKVTDVHRNFWRFRKLGNLAKNWLRREKDTCLKLS